MAVHEEIEQLRQELAKRTKEADSLRNDCSRLSSIKGNLKQTILDLAECRTVLDAVNNSGMGCNDADIAMKKATEALVGIKGELASISEDAYKRRDDVKSSKSEILTLEDQMRIVEKNQEGLIATLTKLKSKQDTYRVRANGAEADLLQTKRRIADEEARNRDLDKSARYDISKLVEEREKAKEMVDQIVSKLRGELTDLEEFVGRQMMMFTQSKRIKYSSA